MAAVPKPAPKPKKKPSYLRPYRLRPTVVVIPATFPKPKEYDRAEDHQNRAETVKRDKGLCQWHLRKLKEHKAGEQVHHIHGRRRDWSMRGMLLLCYECHDGYHKALTDREGNKYTTEAFEGLIDLIYK